MNYILHVSHYSFCCVFYVCRAVDKNTIGMELGTYYALKQVIIAFGIEE